MGSEGDFEADIDAGITASVLKIGFDKINEIWNPLDAKIHSLLELVPAISRGTEMPGSRA